MTDIISIAFLVGFFGDFLLQILDQGWGLREYFKQHGKAESMCIAGGMMVLFYILYLQTNLPLTYTYLAIYGIIIDLIFRKFMIFPSLKGYYEYLNYFWSGFWEAFSMVLPLFIFNYVNK